MYYIQYAYARVCSVFRQLTAKHQVYNELAGLNSLGLLTEAQELKLLATLTRYPDVILNAASQHEPHILTNICGSCE